MAIASAILMIPIGVEAQESDIQSLWYGYIYGGAVVTCEWLKSGSLSRDAAKEFLRVYFEKNDKVPYAASAKALDTARRNKDLDQCPLPR